MTDVSDLAAPLPSFAEQVASIRRHVDALASLPADGLARAVPSCPGWDVGTLLAHCGAVHEWVVGWLEEQDPNPGYDERMDTSRGAGVRQWYRATGSRMADLIEERGPDHPCGTFVGPDRVAFWARRQANELLIHRWDAESSLGAPSALEVGEALLGVDEWVLMFVPRLRRRLAHEEGAPSVALVAEDRARPGDPAMAWLVERPAGEVRSARLDPATVVADAVVRGTAEDLVLAVWHRGHEHRGRGRLVVEGPAEAVDTLLDPAHIR